MLAFLIYDISMARQVEPGMQPSSPEHGVPGTVRAARQLVALGALASEVRAPLCELRARSLGLVARGSMHRL